MQTDTNQLLQLPEALRRQFEAVQRRLWKVDTIIAISGAVSGLIVSYVLQFVSDRFWDTPRWLRALHSPVRVCSCRCTSCTAG